MANSKRKQQINASEKWDAIVTGITWEGFKGTVKYPFTFSPTREDVLAVAVDFRRETIERIRVLHTITTTVTEMAVL